VALYRAILDDHRRLLNRVVDRAGVDDLRRLYETTQARVMARLRYLTRAGRGDTFTAYHARLVAAQLRDAESTLAARMGEEMAGLTRRASAESLESLIDGVKRLEAHYAGVEPTLRVEEAARFAGVLDARRPSLLRQHAESMQRYGADLIGGMERELSVTTLAGGTVGDAIDRVQAVADNHWWQAERIARTEGMWAANAAHVDGLEEIGRDVPDLYTRWVEYCEDDADATPLDDRVAIDSRAMHGQVVRAGGSFVMPPTAPTGEPVPKGMAGETWRFPPNRPQDRACVAAWRPAWGVPGWRWEGERVPVRG